MGGTLPERFGWLEHALQGLAFWIGHRQSLFRGYPLSEGALVAEACNLIQANLPKELVLLPECLYRNLLPGGIALDQGKLIRADLAICVSAAQAVGRNGDLSNHVQVVVEVKRGSATKAEVDADLLRLHDFKQKAGADKRCFLFVISEGSTLSRFVKNGSSKLGAQPIPKRDGSYRVRRTVKAAASFSGKNTAHYVCLIEVFLKGQHAKKL